jgi:hypothetical protein
VSENAEWVTGTNSLYGSLPLQVSTASHSYNWQADGFYSQFFLSRDGQTIAQINGYNPQRNVWHSLRLDMLRGTLYAYFDGSLITSYNETSTNNALTQFGPAAGWKSTDSFNLLKGAVLKYYLTFQGYDYDGGHEETLTLNNHQLAQLPPVDTPGNAGVYVTFSLDMTSFAVKGPNTLVFAHANWDCGVVDNTKNVQITDATGAVIFSDPTVRPLSCTQSITYNFTIS